MGRVQLDTDGNELEGEYELVSLKSKGFKRRRWYHRRDFRFVAFVVACIVAFQFYGFATGPGKVTDKLKTAMIAGNKIDVLVWAKFPAEAFHMEIYQELGALSGEQDGAVRVGGVMPGELNSCPVNIGLIRSTWPRPVIFQQSNARTKVNPAQRK